MSLRDDVVFALNDKIKYVEKTIWRKTHVPDRNKHVNLWEEEQTLKFYKDCLTVINGEG